jgi:hypothetical protein
MPPAKDVSLAIQSFDLLSGTLDGINSEGLVVSIMADEEALAELGQALLRTCAPERCGTVFTTSNPEASSSVLSC